MVLETPSGRTVLEVRNLHLEPKGGGRAGPVLVDVSLELKAGEFAAVFGEDGSGTSILALAISGLLPAHKFEAGGGSMRVAGGDAAAGLTAVRGRHPARDMVYVGPGLAGGGHLLDPGETIERQMARRIQARLPVDRMEAVLIAEQLLRDMALGDPARVLAAYPRALAADTQWRVLAAMAFAANPRVICLTSAPMEQISGIA